MEIELSKEFKEQLTSFLPMNNNATFKFKPDVYSQLMGTEEEIEFMTPIVEVRQWNNSEVEAVKNQLFRDAGSKSSKKKTRDEKKVMIKLIKDAVINIDNLRDEHLNVMEYDVSKLTMLNESIITNIFDKISDISGFEHLLITQMKRNIKANTKHTVVEADTSK